MRLSKVQRVVRAGAVWRSASASCAWSLEVCDGGFFGIFELTDTNLVFFLFPSRLEYRPLEGFVYAITPFNFTAIAGNLPCAPALLGNVVIWKPSPHAILSNWVLYRILLEAGLPPNVIQFLPGDAERITATILAHHEFAALHYTGSSEVFRSLYGRIGDGIRKAQYKSYPRVVGETGGKNFHLVHGSADVRNAVMQTVRAAFEFQGQKCSACSRCYVARSIWPAFKDGLIKATKGLSIGDPTETDEGKSSKGLSSFIGPVIHRASFDKLSGVIDAARSDSELELVVGGTHDCSKGYYIHPTIYQTKNPRHELMSRELFGPILVVYVYDDADDDNNNNNSNNNNENPTGNNDNNNNNKQLSLIPKTTHPTEQHLAQLSNLANLISTTSPYALTGALFATSRPVIHHLSTSCVSFTAPAVPLSSSSSPSSLPVKTSDTPRIVHGELLHQLQVHRRRGRPATVWRWPGERDEPEGWQCGAVGQFRGDEVREGGVWWGCCCCCCCCSWRSRIRIRIRWRWRR